MRGLMIGAAVSALLLAAGCSKPADNAANASAAVSNGAATVASAAASTATAAANVAATAAGPAGPIELGQLPAPPAGEWTRVSSQDGAAAETSPKCLSGKPIDPMDGLPGKCASVTATRTATGGFVVVAECPANGINAKLTLAGEGDFSKSFTTDATMSMTGGPGGDLNTKNHSTYTYVGPTCSK